MPKYMLTASKSLILILGTALVATAPALAQSDPARPASTTAPPPASGQKDRTDAPDGPAAGKKVKTETEKVEDGKVKPPPPAPPADNDEDAPPAAGAARPPRGQ